MSNLFDRIRNAVVEDQFIIGVHADDRLRERRIAAWQVIAGLQDGRCTRQRDDAQPNPVIEVEQMLPNGQFVKAVWSWIEADQVAKLVTVHLINQ